MKSLRQVKSDFTGTKVPRFWMALLSAEEVLFQERTDAEELGGDDAEDDNY